MGPQDRLIEAFLNVAEKQQRRFRVLAARTVRFLPLPRLRSRSVRRRRGNATVTCPGPLARWAYSPTNLPLLLLQYPLWLGRHDSHPGILNLQPPVQAPGGW